MSSHLKPGSKVSFLREIGHGTIVEIQDDSCLVEDDNGFDMWYNVSDLVPFMNVTEDKLFSNKSAHDKMSSDIKKRESFSSKESDDWSIDLHIENITASNKGMTNHEIVLTQLKHFKSFLAKAEKARAGRLLVIHGQGTGKLKSEIQYIVRGIKGVEMFDADFRQGASIIERKYNIR